jgi:AcrR family transcriptional regulator
MTSGPRPVRSDARENQRRIVAAATAAFAESGDASLNEIARRAGVGPGTLYRHFPTREALIVAVYRQEIQALADLAPALLAEHPPVQALRLWLDQTARYGQLKYGASAVIHAATSAGLETEAYGLVIGAITALLAGGREAGLLRPDVDPDDFLLLISFLWRIPPGPDAEARAARMIDLVLQGILARS